MSATINPINTNVHTMDDVRRVLQQLQQYIQTASYTPVAHHTTHEAGGSDVLRTFTPDSGTGGTVGYVPAPGAGDGAAGKVLGADGTWKNNASIKYVAKSSGFTLAQSDNGSFFECAAGAGLTITLPSASTLTAGSYFYACFLSGSAVSITPNGSDGIYPFAVGASALLQTIGDILGLICTGANGAHGWEIFDFKRKFTGDSGSGGFSGLVPAPASGDAAAKKYLFADGTWRTIVESDVTNLVSDLASKMNESQVMERLLFAP